MKFSCVIVCERGREAINQLRRACPDPPWVMRHLLDLADVRELLQATSAVLVMGPGQDAEQSLELLAWLQEQGKSVRTVWLRTARDAVVETLAWDLGSAAILVGDQRQALPTIVRGLAARLGG